ncbi:sulfite exporter TauE/SafE (macronuclear) [Tetrahymena thermophila SB210]|uniref:Sulfite exporter TauE/SafE n=1 Tax=Tetrahymena thermophila (strain SB210) TaxID=312017 RepID=Q22AS3_TETTS|nr:sulfite exporter TauE/SafE [Tetrahymena thermophila SB210]EAR82395.2 sulfite exporter TauE/SafE [Tetrahymena thermophila SB210]|eukprot:XP_001030058.2 sulfite exporter TauE/SafE [Tetrahymena thermophila SB210]
MKLSILYKKMSIKKIILLMLLLAIIKCDDTIVQSIQSKDQQNENSPSASNSTNQSPSQNDKTILQQTENQESDSDDTQLTSQENELEHQCEADSDCGYMQVCNQHFQCQRKNLFPMTLTELLGSVVILVVVGIGQAAGIGGGLIVVPVLMSFFGYETKKSIALVFITIFSASLGNLMSFMKQKSKDGGPVIDYRIVVLSLPTIMVGSIYGVALNKFIPQIVLAFALAFFILQSLTKTYKSYKREKAKEVQENQNNNKSDQSSPLYELKQPNENGLPPISQSSKKEQYPKSLLSKIFCITLGFAVFSLLRGGSKFDSLLGIPPCGFLYQISNLASAYVAYLLVKGIIAGLVIQNKIEEKLVVNTSSDDTQLTAQEMQGFAVTAFLAGLIGSTFGLGGGMVLVPKWLEQGIPSYKTTPCSISLLFLTAFNSAIQFALGGVYETEEIIYFSVIALLSSFIVSSSIQQYVKKTNQASLLILIIIGFMIIAFCLFGTMNVQKAMVDLPSLFDFGQFC